MSSCCNTPPQGKAKPDILLWGSFSTVAVFYVLGMLFSEAIATSSILETMAHTAHTMIHATWWGILIGMVFIGLLGKIPRQFITHLLGQGGTFSGILRATGAGVILDLCSHGILLVGSRLYERGASGGQVIAFLLASPWNSLSFTLILIGLIGVTWTLLFILFSMIIAMITGYIFDHLIRRNVLPSNQNHIDIPEHFHFFAEAKTGLAQTSFDRLFFKEVLVEGVQGSRLVVRWLLFGILLAMVMRVIFEPAQFEEYFGASLIGLSLTIMLATALEVCSEGSIPIAADLVTRAHAPGNGFTFLMGGVATDYTEIMVMKDTTKSWKFALFLPLISLPQIIAIAWLMNQTV
ncbi:MAG: permease [Candidatus Oxydemutatoraceae bacterium WSBS_2016_MAG_OTU14]